ncbi:hypothetical protein MNBD_GAMMA24-2388 [hydrothermal vent metagenome]|uniref:Uncharacterized protein n=1 Tax=hydrothermal vent metagenome TaxID=652676 RepID=A0A3B1BL75_9ZZZZ
MSGERWFWARRGFKYPARLKSLAVLSLSVFLAACGGGSENNDNSGLAARLNPDGTPTSSSGGGATAAGGTPAAGGATASPADSPLPSVEINSPSQVKIGMPVAINVSVNNAKGKVNYSLSGAPPGMLINASSGAISWTPVGLNFGQNTQFNYRVSATDDVGTTTKTASIKLTDDSHQPLVRSSARVPTKQNSIHIGDFNGDGKNEVLVTDNLSLIYTLKWDASLNNGRGDFYQEWVYPYSLGNQASIDAIDAADVNGDGRLDIIVLNGNTVSVIDGASRTLAYAYEIADAQRGYAVFARNIDTDPAIEIVTLVSKGPDQEQLNIFTLPTGDSKTLNNDWTSEVKNYGTSMLVANVDFADDWPEIVTSAGYVFDGVSLKDEWTRAKPPRGFGDQIVAADVDGDGLGVDEIVGLYPQTANGIIEVFSPQHQSSLFSEPYPLRKPESTRCSMAVSDLDSNGQDEIIVGACIDGAGVGTNTDGEYLKIFTTYDSAVFSSGQEWIRLKNNGVFYDDRLHGGFVSLAVGDVDNDGHPEAIWANKFGGNKYNAFTVLPLPQDPAANIRRQTIKSQNLTLGLMKTPFTGAVDFQFSATQRYATFMSSSDPAEKPDAGASEYKHGARLMFVDYDSGRVNISSQVAATNTTIAGTRLQAEDVMGLGYDQLVLTSGGDDVDKRELTRFQLLNFGPRISPDNTVHHGWQPARNDYFENLLGGGLANGFDLADIDGDGRLDLAGYIGSYLYSVDFGYDQNKVFEYLKKWQLSIDEQSLDIAIDDLDDDGINDLLRLTATNLYIRKRDRDVQHQNSNFYDTVFLFNNIFDGDTLTAMQVVDINADGQKEIIVSAKTSKGGSIYLLDNKAKTLAEVAVEGEVTDFQRGQSDNSVLVAWKKGGDAEHIETAYVSEFVISSDMQTVTEVMRSPALLGPVSPNSMNYGKDGRLLLGTQFGMYITR